MFMADFTLPTNRRQTTFFGIDILQWWSLGWPIRWPEKFSYAAWQNLLKKALWHCNRSSLQARRSKKRARKLYSRHQLIDKQTEAIIQTLQTQEPVNNQGENNSFDLGKKEEKLELVTMLKQFLERKHISKHVEAHIPDHRSQELITYSKQSIMMSALAIFIFRIASGNRYDIRWHDKDEKYSRANIAKFIDAPEEQVPVIKTIENFLKNLEEKSTNDLMIAFFKDLQQSKFFRQHSQIMPGDFFLLAADCVHTHTYDHPHHTDADGNNDCDYCLKRVYNRGTEKEKVRWMHNMLVYCFVFMGGLKIPIYRHPIHVRQIGNLEDASENSHKQECELTSLKITLPIIREEFSKMKIVFLLDGLYANRPIIRLLKDHGCGYIIVRKEGSLPSLAQDCDGQTRLPYHRKNSTKRNHIVHNGWVIEREYEWFNTVDIGEDVDNFLLTINVLRFSETKVKDGKTEMYKCEWLFSWRLSAKTCETSAFLARLRWEEEDLFNTLKNRDFNLQHDYSRDPRSFCNWQGLALLAFGIFELFRFSEAVKQRSDLLQNALAEKLLGQLLHRPTEELFSEWHSLKKIQFRYNFVIDVVFPNTMDLEALETG